MNGSGSPAIEVARAHYLAGRLDDAVRVLRQAPPSDAGSPDVLLLLAEIHARKGEMVAAADFAMRAVSRGDAAPHLLLEVARLCQASGRHTDAIKVLTRLVRVQPGHASAQLLLAQSHAEQGDPAKALQLLDALLIAQPHSHELHYNRGWILGRLGQLDEETAAYQAALALRPNFVPAHINLGVAQREQHRFAEALRQFERALQIDPYCADAHTNRAQTCLMIGDFETGWREYEWRWRDGGQGHGFDPAKQWTGRQPIAGRRLLVHHEQGLGDTLQFVRYVPLLVEAGAKVLLRVQTSLVPLLAPSLATVRVFAENEPAPVHDLHCPLLSLPLAFGTTAESIPAAIPYLRAPPERREKWRELLGEQRDRPRVGIAWTGSKVDPNRRIPLDELGPLLDARADFFSLVKDVPPIDYKTLARRTGIINHGRGLRDFADTAALVAELDLVITIDTSLAHLAGALGAALWIALPFTPDWRWQMDRPDSPWYPQARLFRQCRRGDWKTVVLAMADALQVWLSSLACSKSSGG